MYVPRDLHAAIFSRNQALLEHQFINTNDFKRFLEELGTPFTHDVGGDIKLSDLFVYPDLKVTTFSAADKDTVIKSADVLEYIFQKRRVMIAGSATCGKTSLAKALYSDLLSKKKVVPVFLRGDAIRASGPAQVFSAVTRAVEQQYSNRKITNFEQLDSSSVAIIIDDWHKWKLTAKSRNKVLEALTQKYERVIAITDDASLLHQLSDASETGSVREYEYCEIKPFGYHLRGELVIKWETLGHEFGTDELELTRDISESEHFLDALIATGIVPSFPFFVFSALQARDSTVTNNAAYGSYGHIYQALLAARLARPNAKQLGLKFSYLSHVAYAMFKNSRAYVSVAELDAIHRQYEKEFMVTVDSKQLRDEIEAAGILNTSNEELRFAHKYAFYFFVAQYFHDGISNVHDADVLRSTLRQIADRANNDDNAHILIFYLYMSKDRVVIEHILANAAKVFQDCAKANLDSDVEFANRLCVHSSLIEAPSVDTDRNRQEYLQGKDDVAEVNADTDNESAESEVPGSQLFQINFAFQSLNIMGQVLKNFPGDLRRDLKLQLTEHSYALGLRTLTAFLNDIRTEVDELRVAIASVLRMHQPFVKRSETEVQVAADRAVIALTELGVVGLIKKVSRAIGAQELRDVYEAMRVAAGDHDIPTRLLDLSLKLDHFALVPENDVADLKKRLSTNFVAYTTLRMLVAEFLSLFPVDYKLRQRLIKLLDFQPGAATLSGEKRVKTLSAKAD